MSEAYNKLTPKRRAFVDALIKTGDVQQSYIEAGYEPAHAHTAAYRLRNRVDVSQAYQDLQDEALQRRKQFLAERGAAMLEEYSKEFVLDGLKAEAENFSNSGSERISAYVAIARIQGYLQTKPPVQINAVQINVSEDQRGVL